jgi:ubiquinone/menaquinone biosynthesis C-methylase UbiE
MFKCPRCRERLTDTRCEKCDYEIPYHNGVYYFTDDFNLNLNDEQKYIGYDEINLDFEPPLIYWPDRWRDNFGVYGASAKKLVENMGTDITILDLGCGLGTATIPLAQTGAKVIGIDISEVMLLNAKKRLKQKYDNLYFCKMNAYDLMISDHSVDVVVENAMIHLVNDPAKIYEEIKRVLKPDGLLVRFMTITIPVSEEQTLESRKVYDAFKDISNYYQNTLKDMGYSPIEFNNKSYEIEPYYFEKVETVKTDYEEEFNEFMKFRIHRLEHKAFSPFQNIPDEVHKQVWNKTNDYAISKYGSDYKNMRNYSKYMASYDVYKMR